MIVQLSCTVIGTGSHALLQTGDRYSKARLEEALYRFGDIRVWR